MAKDRKVGRLALRQEGEWWEAYYAEPDSMEGAIPLGRIRMTIIDHDPALKDAFKQLMRLVVQGVLEDVLGTEIKRWDEQPAPENERSGNA